MKSKVIHKRLLIKIIALAVTISFLCQNVATAGPFIKRDTKHALAPKSIFEDSNTDKNQLRNKISKLLDTILQEDKLRKSSKRRKFLAENLPQIPELRKMMFNLLAPLKGVALREKRRISRALVNEGYLSRSDILKIRKIAKMAIPNIVMDYLEEHDGIVPQKQFYKDMENELALKRIDFRGGVNNLIVRHELVFRDNERGENCVFTTSKYVELFLKVLKEDSTKDLDNFLDKSPIYRSAIREKDPVIREELKELLYDFAVMSKDPQDQYYILSERGAQLDVIEFLSSFKTTAENRQYIYSQLRRISSLSDNRRLDAFSPIYFFLKYVLGEDIHNIRYLGWAMDRILELLNGNLMKSGVIVTDINNVIRELPSKDYPLEEKYRQFCDEVKVSPDIACAFFILCFDMFKDDKDTFESVKRVISLIDKDDFYLYDQFITDFYMIKYYRNPYLKHIFKSARNLTKDDLPGFFESLRFISILNEYKPGELGSVVNTDTFLLQKNIAEINGYLSDVLKGIENKNLETTKVLIEKLWMDHKRDSQETDFVISPIIESGTSWTVISDAVAQITMIIRPSQKTRNNYPEQMDALQHARNYSIPYRDIIGQIIGTFATVNGERVFYVGEIQSFGYWNLSRSMRNRMKKWMPFIIGRLEEKLSSIGIKTIYIEDLGILGSLTPKNAMIHYGVLLNEEYGYKRTVVNVSFYPKSKEENKKCMYKHIFKKESKPAEGQEKFVEKTIYEKTHRLPKKIVDNIDNRAEMNDMDDMIGLYWLIFKPRWTTKYYRMMKIHLRNAIKMQGKDISHTPTPRIWVYRDESGRVRGYTTVLLSKGSDEMIKVHIAEAAVDENCQNQGIAYALKAVMMEDMQALGATLFTTNPTGKKTEDEKKYISEVMAEEFGFKWAENGSNKMVFDAAKLSKKEEKLIKVEGEKAKSAKPVKVKIDETSKANVLIEVSL